jgi:hypothetical protein
MNEEQWRTAASGYWMLRYLTHTRRIGRSLKGQRRLGLFTVACLRLVWDSMDPSWRAVLEALEREVAGLAPQGEASRLLATSQLPEPILSGTADSAVALAVEDLSRENWSDSYRVGQLAFRAAYAYARSSAENAHPGDEASNLALTAAYAHHADLLREIFGNPFRPQPKRKFPADLLGLAQSCYDDRAHYPLLADALEDLGETQAAAHCRLTGHVRGCHVVDWILGKT